MKFVLAIVFIFVMIIVVSMVIALLIEMRTLHETNIKIRIFFKSKPSEILSPKIRLCVSSIVHIETS